MEGKPKIKKLTNKELAFCNEYVKDWNATRAAISAGYSEKCAKEIGCENLTKPHIKERIEHVKDNLDMMLGISKAKVLQEHMKLAFSSIAHLHDTWIKRKDFEALTDEQKTCISEISTQTRTVVQNEIAVDIEFIKVKMYDKQKSLEAISRLMGYDAPLKSDNVVKLKLGSDLEDEEYV